MTATEGVAGPAPKSTNRLGRPTALALVVAVTWGVGLLGAAAVVPFYEGVTHSSTGATTSSTQTLIEENGTSALLPVGLPLVIALGVAFILIWRRAHGRPGAGRIAWTIVGLLGVFNLLAMMTIGLFIVPLTAALFVACRTTRRGPCPTARTGTGPETGNRSDRAATMSPMSTIGVVVGNPKPKSRHATVAETVADRAARAAGLDDGDRFTVDLADMASELFDWSSTPVKEAVERVASADLLIVASPTYKATYTGLLKAFLDWFSTTGLSGVTTVPVLVGAGPTHALAVEVHLRPVLIEIGASLPTRGLYVLEQQLDDLDLVIDAWLVEGAAPLRVAVRR